jgi:hypothetical protein
MSYTEVESFEVGRCTVHIVLDDNPQNPRKEFDNVGTMVCWHPNYSLGDVDGRRSYGSGEDFLRSLAGDHTEEDADEMEMEQVWKLVHEYYAILPLSLYDHSGITMFVGKRGDYPFDSAGWDTSNVGFIYCSLAKAQHEWGTEDSKVKGWDGEASFTLKPDGSKRTLREAAEAYLGGEVETYDQYLTGMVYAYVIETPDDEHAESCWGFFGEIEYVREEARAAAESENEKLDAEDEEEFAMACRDIETK